MHKLSKIYAFINVLVGVSFIVSSLYGWGSGLVMAYAPIVPAFFASIYYIKENPEKLLPDDRSAIANVMLFPFIWFGCIIIYGILFAFVLGLSEIFIELNAGPLVYGIILIFFCGYYIREELVSIPWRIGNYVYTISFGQISAYQERKRAEREDYGREKAEIIALIGDVVGGEIER